MARNVYLSEPGVICCAGANAEEFFDSLVNGDQSFILKVKCALDEYSPAADGTADSATAGMGTDGTARDTDSAASQSSAVSATQSADSSSSAAAREFYAGRISDEKLNRLADSSSSAVLPFARDGLLDERVARIMDCALSQIAGAAKKAARLYGKSRIAVCVGSCDNGSSLSLKAHRALFSKGAFPSDYNIKMQGADFPAVYASRKFGLEESGSIVLAFATACSSSASAIIKASQLIQSGLADAVIAGGVDIASDTVLLGFGSLEAISAEKTNPFSANRSGITLGEGAAFFVLAKDDLDSAGIILAGTGESSDAHHMTAPLEDGSGAARAMKNALSDARVQPEQIDYINLHGTGTRLNDAAEAKAVSAVFGSQSAPFVSSTKPVTGHTLGAAGALELAACFLAIKNQRLPVHVWDGIKDSALPELNFVSKAAKSDRIGGTDEKAIRCCMSNSFAFGGCNTVLIIRQVDSK